MMPDILIRGMEMPHSCLECTLCAFDGCDSDYCPFTGIEALSIGRQDNCPLVELPPHGNLIDIRTVLEIVMQYVPDDDGSCSKANADLRELLDAIENAPVVIPAEQEAQSE